MSAKEWTSVKRGLTGTVVTVSLVEGNLSARWSVRAYTTTIKPSVRDARASAYQMLDEMRLAIKELDE